MDGQYIRNVTTKKTGKVIQWMPNLAAAQSRLSPNAAVALMSFVQVEMSDGSVTLWNTAEINTHVSIEERWPDKLI